MEDVFHKISRSVLVLVLLLSGAAQADTKPLQVGILPTLSPRVLLKSYEYLRHYLARELQQPLVLGTATDFRTFHSQVMAGEYDVVVTAAHLARLAQREKGWLPIATYKTANRAILLVSNTGMIESVDDLREKSIASADSLALVAIQAQQWLSEKGLKQNRDYQFIDARSFTSAVHAVLQRHAALAIVSPASYQQLPDTLKSATRIFQILPEIPAVIWMVPPKSRIDPARLKALLLNFTTELPEGREFFQITGYAGIRPVTEEQMQALDKYADEAKFLLHAPLSPTLP